MIPTEKEILSNINKLIEEEGFTSKTNDDPIEKLEKFILPGLLNSKSTLSSIYNWEPSTNKYGILGKLKVFILRRLKNIIVNVFERNAMKQQKFNDLVYEAIITLKDIKDKQN